MNGNIENRSDKRITAGYKTEILYAGSSYSGIIENISASGVNVLTDTLSSQIIFQPDDPVELKFEPPSGEAVIIKCTIMWSSAIPPHNIRHRIGMEITELPWEKTAFFL